MARGMVKELDMSVSERVKEGGVEYVDDKVLLYCKYESRLVGVHMRSGDAA